MLYKRTGAQFTEQEVDLQLSAQKSSASKTLLTAEMDLEKELTIDLLPFLSCATVFPNEAAVQEKYLLIDTRTVVI